MLERDLKEVIAKVMEFDYINVIELESFFAVIVVYGDDAKRFFVGKEDGKVTNIYDSSDVSLREFNELQEALEDVI